MAGYRRDERRGVSLTRASLILIGVGVLWAGGAAGFGIGYKFEQGRTKSAAKSASTKPKGKAKAKAAATQLRLQKERVCLAGQGLHWPKVAGKFATQLKKPPPGVTTAKYHQALIACYGASAKGKGAPPTTDGSAAGSG